MTFCVDARACFARHVAGFLSIKLKLLPRSTLEGLGAYVATIGLPRLQRLNVRHTTFSDECMQELAKGLRSGALPSLRTLHVDHNQVFGDAGASALAAALSRGARCPRSTFSASP